MRKFGMLLLLLVISVMFCGCGALLDAAFRESQDHGDHARYENKSFFHHFFDALEDDDDDDGCRSPVRDPSRIR